MKHNQPLPLSTLALVIAAICLFLWLMTGHAFAQSTPGGMPVLNNTQARLLTKSDTTAVPITHAVYIGDAAACDIAVILSRDTSAVTFSKVQPGSTVPIQIRKLMSTNTTCTVVIALY